MTSQSAIRILRQKWKPEQIDALAQEVFAQFNTQADQTTVGPQTVDTTATPGPALTLQPNQTDPRPTQNSQDPGMVIQTPGDGGGTTTLTTGGDITYQENPPMQGGTGVGKPNPPAPGFAPGTVISGAGDTYQVSIPTPKGPAIVICKIVQIDPTETIPAGTGLILVRMGKTYYAQVPVWVADASSGLSS